MALGKRRRERQLEAFVAASDLPKPPGHPFYPALNRVLAANGFDPLVEKLCAPCYAENFVRPGCAAGRLLPPALRRLLRVAAVAPGDLWRCTDSRSLGEVLDLAPTDPVPNHSRVSKTHKRIPQEVFDEVFNFILSVPAHKGLLWGEGTCSPAALPTRPRRSTPRSIRR